MDLVAIANYCADNRPGLGVLEYAPIAWIDTLAYEPLLSSAYNWQTAIVFTQGGWLKAPFLPRPIWSEGEAPSEQGPSYPQSIEFTTPRLRPAVNGLFYQMSQHRYLVRGTDRQGQPWLIGTLNSPCEFSCEGNTGGSGQLAGYRLRFATQVAHRAPGYVPVL